MASSICYDAVTKGKQTIFLTLFDLTAKLTKARSVYSLIDYYAKVPVLCLDEVGYVMPTREHADYSLPDRLEEGWRPALPSLPRTFYALKLIRGLMRSLLLCGARFWRAPHRVTLCFFCPA